MRRELRDTTTTTTRHLTSKVQDVERAQGHQSLAVDPRFRAAEAAQHQQHQYFERKFAALENNRTRYAAGVDAEFCDIADQARRIEQEKAAATATARGGPEKAAAVATAAFSA